jgi:hypothetical protein
MIDSWYADQERTPHLDRCEIRDNSNTLGQLLHSILNPAIAVILLLITLVGSNIGLRILAGTKLKNIAFYSTFGASLLVVAILWLLSIVTLEVLFVAFIVIAVPYSIIELIRASFYLSK